MSQCNSVHTIVLHTTISEASRPVYKDNSSLIVSAIRMLE